MTANACPSGHKVDTGQRFCPECGSRLLAPPTNVGDTASSATSTPRFTPRPTSSTSNPLDQVLTNKWFVPSVLGAGLLTVLIIFSAASGGTGDSTTVNGSDLEGELRRQFRESGTGLPLAGASCPNMRLARGDTVVCTVSFVDGSFRDVSLKVRSAESGRVKIDVDLAN